MVYSQSRLDEAIKVVREDNARRQQELDDKYARTHYRDDFQLRSQPKSSFIPTRLCRDSGSDLDDEDYDPNRTKSRRTGLGNSSAATTTPKRRAKTKLLSKDRTVVGKKDTTSVFLTLKFHLTQSKALLRHLAEQYQTHLNAWMSSFSHLNSFQWSADFDSDQDDTRARKKRTSCLHESGGSPLAGAVKDTDGSLVHISRLRSGKIRRTVLRIRSDDTGEDSKDPQKVDTAVSLGPTLYLGGSRSEGRGSKGGSSTKDAIVIDDSDEEDRGAKGVSNIHDSHDAFTILTPFAHPIQFQSASRPCSFCHDYRFGIVGHSLREVTVSRNARGELIELGDQGHGQTNPPTSICISCALDRMAITRCESHKLIHIPNARSIKEIDAREYGHDLINQDPKRSLHPPCGIRHICSCCPFPATRQCDALQKHDRILNPVRDPFRPLEDQLRELNELKQRNPRRSSTLRLQDPIFGCGLLLCDTCTMVVERYRGKLDRKEIVRPATMRGAHRPVRADVDFLFKQGPLWEAYHPH